MCTEEKLDTLGQDQKTIMKTLEQMAEASRVNFDWMNRSNVLLEKKILESRSQLETRMNTYHRSVTDQLLASDQLMNIKAASLETQLDQAMQTQSMMMKFDIAYVWDRIGECSIKVYEKLGLLVRCHQDAVDKLSELWQRQAGHVFDGDDNDDSFDLLRTDATETGRELPSP